MFLSASISIGQAAEKSSVCVANRFWAKSMRFFQSKLAAFSFERRADLRPFPRAMRCARSLSRARCLLGCHAATGNYISFLLLSAATTTDDDQAQTWLSAFLRCLLRAHTHTHMERATQHSPGWLTQNVNNLPRRAAAAERVSYSESFSANLICAFVQMSARLRPYKQRHRTRWLIFFSCWYRFHYTYIRFITEKGSQVTRI